ncbi:hypothetical protein ACFFHK_01695 [Gallibacterium trehalosifermentans]|uniref:Uncharacterized protein n=1 Tax=Gallibacterium trehalosifermentans TaxID=516935 RepID=A0ABV6GYQ6_9PAST
MFKLLTQGSRLKKIAKLSKKAKEDQLTDKEQKKLDTLRKEVTMNALLPDSTLVAMKAVEATATSAKFIGKAAKEIATAAKCSAGWHAGQFKPAIAGPECKLEKDCPDCGEHVVIYKHFYTEWEYTKYDSCNAVRFCEYCGKVEQEERHNYVIVRKDSNCRIVERCFRCGGQKIGREDHNWIEAFGIKECLDCHKTMKKE